MKNEITIGTNVKLLREHLGLTQEQLCEKAKISLSDLSAVEDSTDRIPIAILISICPHLKVSLDHILTTCPNSHNDRERFYDFQGNEIDLYWIAKNLYTADPELLLLLSSGMFLNNPELINKVKEMIISSSTK